MNGIEGSTNAARMVRALPGHPGSAPASDTNGAEQGAIDPVRQSTLAAAWAASSDALAGSGSTDLTGSDQQGFDVYLTYDPVDAGIDDRKPGLLRDLEDWVRSRSSGDARPTSPIRAMVPPEEAIRLHP